MAGCACRRCRCASAESCLPKLCRKTLSYSVHRFQHFIEWNQLAYSGKGDLCSDRCICHTGSITVLARIFDQPADRIADQTEHIHKNSGCCGKGLFRGSAHQFNGCRCRHCRCDSDFCLTSTDCSGDSCIAHSKITDRAGIIKSLFDLFIGKIIGFLEGKQKSRNDTGRSGSRGSYDHTHGSIGFQSCHRVNDSSFQKISAKTFSGIFVI